MNSVVRRITATLFAAQSLATVGTTAATTVGTIAAAQLSGQTAFAGLPLTLYLLGNALGAFPAGHFMERFGRRPGITLGFVVALLGGVCAVLAFSLQGFVVLLVGYLLMGLGRGATDQVRFAAAEIVPAQNRGSAVSWVVLGGTVGGIAGPLAVGPAGRIAAQFGWDKLVGPFFVTTALLFLGGVFAFLLLRPDPRDIGRGLALSAAEHHAAGLPARHLREILRLYPMQLALTAMVFGQVVMVAVMTITPLHMTHENQNLDAVSWVIAAHIFGMYGLSIFTGRVADAFGRGAAIRAGALLLAAACALAPLVESPLLLAGALFLLGLGWNFCYVAGSSLLTDLLRPAERGHVQGTNDLIVGFTSAVGSLGSGVFLATIGYGGIALVGIGITLALLLVAAYLGRLLLRPAMNPSAE